MQFGVTQVQRIDDHADVGGILPRLAHVRYFDEFEGRLVHGGLEILVAFPITIGLFHDDAALEQQLFEDFEDVELGVAGIPHTQRDVLEITKHGHVFGFRLLAHEISPSRVPHTFGGFPVKL